MPIVDVSPMTVQLELDAERQRATQAEVKLRAALTEALKALRAAEGTPPSTRTPLPVQGGLVAPCKEGAYLSDKLAARLAKRLPASALAAASLVVPLQPSAPTSDMAATVKGSKAPSFGTPPPAQGPVPLSKTGGFVSDELAARLAKRLPAAPPAATLCDVSQPLTLDQLEARLAKRLSFTSPLAAERELAGCLAKRLSKSES